MQQKQHCGNVVSNWTYLNCSKRCSLCGLLCVVMLSSFGCHGIYSMHALVFGWVVCSTTTHQIWICLLCHGNTQTRSCFRISENSCSIQTFWICILIRKLVAFVSHRSRNIAGWKMENFQDVLPIENGAIPSSYVSLPEGIPLTLRKSEDQTFQQASKHLAWVILWVIFSTRGVHTWRHVWFIDVSCRRIRP